MLEVWTKTGPLIKPNELREACVVGLTNSAIKSNHIGTKLTDE